MTQLDELLNYCKSKYDSRTCMHANCLNESKCKNRDCNNCEQCLKDIHYYTNTDLDYNCINQTYFYVMKFFYRYASEIAGPILLNMKNLFTNKSLKVVSIGCGPSSELYGIKACVKGLNPSMNLQYHGFDLNPIWNDIQQKNISLFADDSIVYHNTENPFDFIRAEGDVNILVLNYMLSDLARHNNQDQINDFMSQLQSVINAKAIDYLLVNDIYLTKEYRTAYGLLKKLDAECSRIGIPNDNIVRYQYVNPNEWQDKFGKKLNNGKVIFEPKIDLNSIGPWMELKSIVEIIKVK